MKKILLIVMLMVLLTGCGTKTEEDIVNEVTNTNVNEVTNNDNQNNDKVELYSDSTKIVFKHSSNSSLVFYYSGDQITGYEAYLDYEDATTAAVAVSIIQNDTEHYPNTKRVYQKGQYVVVEYNEDEYSGYTLEDVKKTYAALEILQK